MPYPDTLRSTTFTGGDIATLIEGIGVAGYPLTFSTWSPTYTGSGTLAYGTVTTTYAKYIQIGKLVMMWLRASGTVSGSGVEIRFTLPVTAAAANEIFPAGTLEAGSYLIPGMGYLQPTTVGAIYQTSVGNWTAAAGKIILAPGWMYQAA